jgi:thymidine kinase
MSLICIAGPMFSGKTTKMLKRMTVFADCVPNSSCLIINSILDSREEKNKISSHSSSYKGLSDKIATIKSKKLSDVDVSTYTHIGVDECQFFDDLTTTVEKWLSLNKVIVVCGLDGTGTLKPFGQIKELLYLADEFVKITALCSLCVNETVKAGLLLDVSKLRAPFTKKLNYDNQIIDVGKSDKYIAVCRRHFIQNDKNDTDLKNIKKKDGTSENNLST